MKHNIVPSVGDIVEVKQDSPRMGLVVETRLVQVGIRYFKPSMIQGTPTDFIWWIHKANVKVISAA